MRNSHPAFETLGVGTSELPPGYQKIMCHMIFDVNMGENFRIKSQFVADGHDPQTPEAMTCSSVVSRDSL